MEENKRRRRISTPLLLFLILMGITLALCLTVLGIWLHGRSVLRSKTAEPPAISTDSSVLDQHTVYHDGKYYRYKDGLVNLRSSALDSDEKPSSPLPYGNDNQADVVLLAVLDTNSDEMTLISVSRDTMCDIAILDESGDVSGSARAQLALSYSYGDGLATSAALTRETVSNLFYGLDIDGYAAFYMGGIADLNDALGGVTLTVQSDYPFTNLPGCSNLVSGREVTLTGRQARAYIQARHETTTGNEERMQRQKQYLLAMISQARQLISGNPTKAVSLYNAVSDYVLTDLDLSKISYLATEAAQMHFSGDILRVSGTSVLGAGSHMELTVDQDALLELMLSVFYEEFTPESGS